MSEELLRTSLLSLSRCPVCEQSRLRTVGRTPTIHPRSVIQVDLVECLNCLHWFINPTVSQTTLMALYENGSEYVVSDGWQPAKRAFSLPERYIIRRESQRSPKSRKYLEIGVGRGLLLNHFRGLGYECHGVEPGPWARDIPSVVADMKELGRTGFDVVVMADVLEHVQDPLALLKQVSGLVDRGVLYVCLPNSESLRARMSKGNWRMVRPFGHLHFFSRRSLSVMLEASGFQVRELRKTDLVDLSPRRLLRSPHSAPLKMLLFLLQGLCGDQWIARAEKGTGAFL